ncbi:MAG: hypothetical protein RIQ52_141, partial [Pseudomonadota bacterium]
MMAPLRARFNIQHPSFCLDVDLTLPGHGITALFGSSGSGKTTLLRALAGLDRHADAFLALGQEIWQDDTQKIFRPPHLRAVGYVFQEPSLFDHLSVEANLAFGWKRTPLAERRYEPQDIHELMAINGLLQRWPSSLSGGERQRVAIARALLSSPRLLLMDEPLAALDLGRKAEILPCLERLHETLSIPVIYVSHAPDEVARLADHIVVLEAGTVIASGPLTETLARTDLPPIFADEPGVVLDTVVAEHEADELTRLAFADGHLLVPRRKEAPGRRLRCRIHARDVSLALSKPGTSSILNSFEASVTTLIAVATPGHVLVRLIIGKSPLLALITERSSRVLQLQPGQRVWA